MCFVMCRHNADNHCCGRSRWTSANCHYHLHHRRRRLRVLQVITCRFCSLLVAKLYRPMSKFQLPTKLPKMFL